MHRKFGGYSGSVFCLQRIVDEATHSATLTLSAVLLSTPHVLRRNRAINRGSGSRRKDAKKVEYSTIRSSSWFCASRTMGTPFALQRNAHSLARSQITLGA